MGCWVVWHAVVFMRAMHGTRCQAKQSGFIIKYSYWIRVAPVKKELMNTLIYLFQLGVSRSCDVSAIRIESRQSMLVFCRQGNEWIENITSRSWEQHVFQYTSPMVDGNLHECRRIGLDGVEYGELSIHVQLQVEGRQGMG